MPSKVCPACKRDLPLERYAKDRSRRDGHMNRCKDCDNERSKRYYTANRERKLRRIHGSKRYQAQLRPPFPCEDCGAIVPARTRSRRCDDCYPAYRLTQNRDNARKRYNPAREQAKWAKRRRVTNRQISDVTTEHIAALYFKTKRCPLCDVKLTATPRLPHSREVDHIVPINVGGTHTIGNLRVICRRCNLKRPKDGSDIAEQVTLWAFDPALAA